MNNVKGIKETFSELRSSLTLILKSSLNEMKNKTELTQLGLLPSFGIFVFAAVLMFTLTNYLIPYLSSTTEYETIILWFIVGGLGIFLPLIIIGIIILNTEGYKISKSTFAGRLRFQKVTIKDLLFSIAGIIVSGILGGVVFKILELTLGSFNPSPAFISFDPVSSNPYRILLLWFPFWMLNIFGEEFLWRGVMLPRQEIAFGRHAWLIHGFGWGIFHIAFGWKLLLVLTPLLFIQSYIVQKTKNTWTGIIIHGGINGPSFAAICFGLI